MLPTIEDFNSRNGLHDLFFVNKLDSDEIDLIESAIKNYGKLVIEECAETVKEYPLFFKNIMNKKTEIK